MSSASSSESGLRIDRVVTHGIFALDGGEWEVDNNIWIVGDDDEVFVVDAAHDADAIVDAVDGRKVRGVICTHAHNDHITVAPELAERLDTQIYVHPGDEMLWDETHPGVGHADLADGEKFSVAGTTLQVINTPGHSPGSCCLYLPEAKVLLSGDTLFAGGPGATASDVQQVICEVQRQVKHRFGVELEPEVIFLGEF